MDGGLLYCGNLRKWTSISIGALLLGNMDERFFLGAFMLEEFLLGPLEICKMPGRRVTSISLHRGPTEEPGGVPFLDPEVIKI